MMSPQSSGLVPSYVTKIELGQIGATLVLPVSLHSDKFVAGGEKLVSRLGTLTSAGPSSHHLSPDCSSSSLKTNIGSGCGHQLFLQSCKYREKNLDSYLLTLFETCNC